MNHASREYVLTGDELAMRIGGFGPVVVWDDGRILPVEPERQLPSNIRTVGEAVERAMSLPSRDEDEVSRQGED